MPTKPEADNAAQPQPAQHPLPSPSEVADRIHFLELPLRLSTRPGPNQQASDFETTLFAWHGQQLKLLELMSLNRSDDEQFEELHHELTSVSELIVSLTHQFYFAYVQRETELAVAWSQKEAG